jgi:hypothetical protein
MEWINVEDRLPPNGKYVLVALWDPRTKVEMYSIQIAERANKDWFEGREGASILYKGSYVTHWMYLPDDPKIMEKVEK